MKGRELDLLNKAIGLVEGLELGDNPTLIDIKNALKKISDGKAEKLSVIEKPFRDMVNKIYLYKDEYGYYIHKIIKFNSLVKIDCSIDDLEGVSFECESLLRFSFGSFNHVKDKVSNNTYSYDEIRMFKEISDEDASKLLEFKNVIETKTDSFKKEVDNILNK